MARKGAKTIIRYVKSKTGRRGKRRDATKALAKKAAIGAVAGLAISIPLTLGAKYLNQPMLMEVGQRVGSVASAAFGGAPGNAGYLVADALFDRFVVFNGQGVSGQSGQVYL